MKKVDKEKQSTTSEEKADNASLHNKPTIEQKTKQGESETSKHPSGSAYKNTLPPKKPGEKTTDGVDEV